MDALNELCLEGVNMVIGMAGDPIGDPANDEELDPWPTFILDRLLLNWDGMSIPEPMELGTAEFPLLAPLLLL